MKLQAQNHRFLAFDDSGKLLGDLCEECCILRTEIDLLTGHYCVVLRVFTKHGENDRRFDRSVVSRNIMPVLLNLGLSMVDDIDSNKAVVDAVLESEKNAEVVFVHEGLGFHRVKDMSGVEREVFLLYHPIGLLPQDPKALSTYLNEKKLEPKGSLESWIDMVVTDVEGFPNMAIALCCGAAGPLAHILLNRGYITSLPIIGFIGESTTGKTTSARLAASIWGRPTEADGIIMNLNATENAFAEKLAEQRGLTMVLDEITGKELFMRDQCYSISKGVQRGRCLASGSLKRQKSYSGLLLLTGEHSINAVEVEDGVKARIFELSLPFTHSDEHAQAIENAIQDNYALAGSVIAEWVLLNERSIITAYVDILSRLKLKYQKRSNLFARLLKTVAIILVAANMLIELFDFAFDLDKIEDILVQALKASLPEERREDLAYNALISKVLQNRSDFLTKGKEEQYPGSGIKYSAKGMFSKYNGQDCVYIVEDVFGKWLDDAGFPDVKAICKQLHGAKYIVKFGDKYRKRHSDLLNNVCYCLLLNVKYLTDEEQEKEKKKQAQKQRNLRIKRKNKYSHLHIKKDGEKSKE